MRPFLGPRREDRESAGQGETTVVCLEDAEDDTLYRFFGSSPDVMGSIVLKCIIAFLAFGRLFAASTQATRRPQCM